MRNSTPKKIPLRLIASLVLMIVSLALLLAALNVSADSDLQQQIKPPVQEGLAAPMKPIQPVSVSVVNFQKLADAEAKKKAAGIKEGPEQMAVDPPLGRRHGQVRS